MDEREELIRQLIKEKGGTREQYNTLMDSIAYHESAHTMDPSIRQKGGGPGRGLYQFEEGEAAGGITAARRAKKYYEDLGKKVPKWLENSAKGKSLDASKLSKSQQDILFLSNMRKHPKADLGKVMKGEESITDFWANYHWAGEAKDRKARVDSFSSSIGELNKTRSASHIEPERVTEYSKPKLGNDSTKTISNDIKNQAAVAANRTALRKSREQAKKELAKEYVQDNYNEIGNSWLWNLPGSVAPMGAANAAGKAVSQGAKYALSKAGRKAIGKTTSKIGKEIADEYNPFQDPKSFDNLNFPAEEFVSPSTMSNAEWIAPNAIIAGAGGIGAYEMYEQSKEPEGPQQKALGGELGLSTYGDKANYFSTGGTHESNPHGGIPIGNGNSVEQDEVSYKFKTGKFIFSNRIKY